MNIPGVILMVVAAVVAAFVFSQRAADKRADKFEVVGTTMGWQKSKIPFLGQLVIQYTKRGKPFQVGSKLMLKPKQLKVGAMHKWTIYTYRTNGKQPVSLAKKK